MSTNPPSTVHFTDGEAKTQREEAGWILLRVTEGTVPLCSSDSSSQPHPPCVQISQNPGFECH